MKKRFSSIRAGLVVALVFALALAAGCGGMRPPRVPAPEVTVAQNELFQRAEALYNRRDYPGAAAGYRGFLNAYPESPMAAAAWMKLGLIAAAGNDLSKAEEAFGAVTEKFPKSPFAPEARLGLMDVYSRQARYGKVLSTAKKLLTSGTPNWQRAAALGFVGEAYLAKNESRLAAEAYLQAVDLTTGPQKANLTNRLEMAVKALSAPEIQQMAVSAKDCSSIAVLVQALAEKHIQAGNQDLAEELVAKARARCPGEAEEVRFKEIMAEIGRVSGYNPRLFGVLLPLSGPYARFGQKILDGVEIAVARYNMVNPFEPVAIVIKDSEGTAEGADKGFFDLSEEGVAAVIGPLVSADAVKGMARELGIPAVSFTQKESLPEPGSYVFRNYLTPTLQARALVAYAVADRGLRRFAILYPEDAYGEAFMNRFWDQVLEYGGQVTGVEAYEPGSTDVGDPIKKLVGLYYDRPEPEEDETAAFWEEVAPPPDPLPTEETGEAVEEEEEEVVAEEEEPEAIVDFEAVFIPDTPTQAALILPQLSYNDVTRVTPLGTNLWHADKLLDWGESYARGAVFPDLFFSDSKDPAVRAFVDAFSETYGQAPGFWEALGFDSATLLFGAAREPDVHSSKGLRDALASGQVFDGVTGRTSFDDTGEVDKNLFLLRASRKKFVEIKSARPARP